MKTRSLHSSQPPSPNMSSDSSAGRDAARGRHSFRPGEKLANHASSHQRQMSAGASPDTTTASALHSREALMLRRQLDQDDSPDDSGGRQNPSTSESVASQRTQSTIPDRSAKPSGDPDCVGRRRQPRAYPTSAELPSTSLGESAPDIQSTKRPLPESPTSASQPTNTTRRRQHVRERSSREEMGPPSQPGKKGSRNHRSRA